MTDRAIELPKRKTWNPYDRFSHLGMILSQPNKWLAQSDTTPKREPLNSQNAYDFLLFSS